MNTDNCKNRIDSKSSVSQIKAEIDPPWIVFPLSSAVYGWNQGTAEHWKNTIWLPFWDSLSAGQREDYLARHQASSEWIETLMNYWNSRTY